jgi:hypothetical protein
MFPRPVYSAASANVIASSSKAFAPSSDCSELDNAGDCAAATAAAGCTWNADKGTCSMDPAAAGPFSPLPRLFNDLTFPYFILTALTAALLVLSWTPLWPVLLALARPVWALMLRPLAAVWRELSGANYRVAPDGPDRSSLDAAAAIAAEQARLASRPSYERALRDGMFGNFPSGYDLTLISPYDEVSRRAACSRTTVNPSLWQAPPLSNQSV